MDASGGMWERERWKESRVFFDRDQTGSLSRREDWRSQTHCCASSTAETLNICLSDVNFWLNAHRSNNIRIENDRNGCLVMLIAV